MVDIQVKISCQKATNGWLEYSIDEDILLLSKMKESLWWQKYAFWKYEALNCFSERYFINTQSKIYTGLKV